MKLKQLLFFPVLLIVTGCAVTGDYSCGVPENGVKCQSLSDTHEQLMDGSLSSLHTAPYSAENDTSRAKEYEGRGSGTAYRSPNRSTGQTSAPSDKIVSVIPGDAILSDSRVMRIWFDRFTDQRGDLHDESFVYVRIDSGHWVIDNKPVVD